MRDDFDGFDAGSFDEGTGTFEGRAFPSEAEWLSLPSPPISPDFVARTMSALRQEPLEWHEEPGEGDAGDLLTEDRLAAFEAPLPTHDFVARTVRAVQDDRAGRWRELLARYIAPEPSPDFVARTLAALARPADTDDPRPARRSALARVWAWPLLMVAATVALLVLLHEPERAPVELRIAQQVRPALAHAYAVSPLPAVLAELDRQQDPDALPNGEADGLWLLQQRNR